jgi:7-carboxy-7-deazaguanine synthase
MPMPLATDAEPPLTASPTDAGVRASAGGEPHEISSSASRPVALSATAGEFEVIDARRLRVLDGKPAGTLMIHELYLSLQGESTRAGLPCTFIRLTGCPLRCRWCDTPHSFHAGAPMTVPDILREVDRLGENLVEVTGGEPLAQDEVHDLLDALVGAGRTVLLETAGSHPIDRVNPAVTIIMDLKCPSSGELPRNRLENLSRLKDQDELKFVVGDRADFDWSVTMIREHRLVRHPLLMSPVHGELDPTDLARWILESRLPIRLQHQLHKLLWGPTARGV